MSDTQFETQPAPEIAAAGRAQREPAAIDVPTPLREPPAADVGKPVASDVEAGTQAPPVAEAPPANARRDTTTAIIAPWETDLPGVTSADIRAELARRQRRVPKLMAERTVVIQQMEAIEEALASIGEDLPEFEAVPAPRAPKAPRARNAVSLKDAIAAAVEVGATVTPAEVTEAVNREGYVSTAANIGQMVASALAKHAHFERLGRGRYRRIDL
jgi:hypothetical protein